MASRHQNDRMTKPTPRQIQRRERILKVAQEMTAKQDYYAISMRAIAAASKVAEKTLYNIFGSKDRLLAMAAQRRSAGVFEHSAQAVPEGGWPFLLAFTQNIACTTLEKPVTTHTLAHVLLEHSDLVGLDRIYDSYIGQALEQMQKQRLLRGSIPIPYLTKAFRLGITATVVFWTKNEISDAELHPSLNLQLGQILLPFARRGHDATIKAMLDESLAQLSCPRGPGIYYSVL